MLILNHATAYHWAVAGVGIAVITLVLLYVGNRRLGISSGLENLCALVVNTPYFKRAEVVRSRGWRLPFLGGLVIGGALSAVSSGGWAPTWALGMLDTHIGLSPLGKVAWMFVGGTLIGFGTRMAGGCTSGHGIFGLMNFEKSGLVSTLSFMAMGVVTTNLVYRVVVGL